MLLLFVHGWSVHHTKTYGALPQALAARASAHGLDLDIKELHLGRYVSFHDDVTVDDIARAFDHALRNDVPNNANGARVFSCVTHSTGGPVIRTWVQQRFADRLDRIPLRHLVMLAPANHGSALAQLGKERVGRIKAWFQGVEPGTRVLGWLELGSNGGWDLNRAALEHDFANTRFFPSVLTGQTIHEKLYDHLNSYTGEPGSDGVVRVAAANMNYRFAELEQSEEPLENRRFRGHGPSTRLRLVGGSVRRSPAVPLGVLPDASHSGTKLGIMRSVEVSNAAEKPVVEEILRCLKVGTRAQQEQRVRDLALLTDATQGTVEQRDDPLEKNRPNRHCMVVFDVRDDRGDPVPDYDMYFLAGRSYDPDGLPRGFFRDRQGNRSARHRLVYYLNHDRLIELARKESTNFLGIRIRARPHDGLSGYVAAEFRSDGMPLTELLQPNETLYVGVKLRRVVDRETFRLDPAESGPSSFKRVRPGGEEVR